MGRSDGGCVRDLKEGRIMGLSHRKHLAHSAPKEDERTNSIMLRCQANDGSDLFGFSLYSELMIKRVLWCCS